METSQTEISIEPEIDKLVPGFCAARKKDLENIAVFLSKNDFTSVAKICHTIKGIARPYGFPTLETLARQLETSAKAGDLEMSQQLLDQAKQYLQRYYQ